jgi:DNA-binding transcriptional ArsR family regulator
MAEKVGKLIKSEKAEKAERDARQRAADAGREYAAGRFKALGDPTRLRILDLLRAHAAAAVLARGGHASGPPHLESNPAVDGDTIAAEMTEVPPDGSLTVGAISVGIGGKEKVSSTLSHHLKELRQAGLITMKRSGKHQLCRINAAAVEQLRCYLWMPAGIGAMAEIGERPCPGEEGFGNDDDA